MQRIIGFNFEKIHAERKSSPKGKKIQVQSNIDISDIKEEKIELTKDKNALKFDFEFKINYTPNIAEVIFKGHVLGLFDKNKAKDVLKKWKSKKISDELRVPLFNYILTKCSLKALVFEDEFGLPPHIPLPKLGATSIGAKYTG